MRKLVILIFVLWMASLANATVIDVITDGIGDYGHIGTPEDPLQYAERLYFSIVLNHYPYYPGFPSYDGYLLSEMDLALHVTGPGELEVSYDAKSGDSLMGEHDDWTVGSHWREPVWELIQNNSIDDLTYSSDNGICGAEGSPTKLIWNLIVQAEGQGQINVDISLNPGTTRYSPYRLGVGPPYSPFPGGWTDATEADLGDLIIYAVPEPITIVLLGLGGLGLLRRKDS